VHKNFRLTPKGSSFDAGPPRGVASISVMWPTLWESRLRRSRSGSAATAQNVPADCWTDPADRTSWLLRSPPKSRLPGTRDGPAGSSLGSCLSRRPASAGSWAARTCRAGARSSPPPLRRYERQPPGELLRLDSKELGRITRIGHRITGDHRGPFGKAG
jgi:hypothetical protein